MRQLSLFADQRAYDFLDKLGDPLARLDTIIDWSPFVKVIDEARPDRTKSGVGGRPPINSLTLFKCLLLGEFNNLSDEALEYQITVRLDFKRFVGLDLTEKSPDRNTFWLLKETLRKTGKYADLFSAFWTMLKTVGITYSKGAIVDATFVDAPKRRVTTKEENEQLKGGEIPERFMNPQSEVEKHRASQTDVDARWTKKNENSYFGYKDHVAVDKETKLIAAHEVTPASVHDSQKLVAVVPENTQEVYDDAGYVGEEIDRSLKGKCPGVTHFTCAKAFRNKPLTDEQKTRNRDISHIRARVEHVFGRMTYCMGGLSVRCIGLARAKCQITLRDLAYNIQRYATMVKYGRAPVLRAV